MPTNITCTDVIKDDSGNITELICSYDPKSRGGWSDDGRKVKGTLHWVSAEHAIPLEVRLYEHLFSIPDLGDIEEGKSYLDYLNPESLIVNKSALGEKLTGRSHTGQSFQIPASGLFFPPTTIITAMNRLFNRVQQPRDSWAKQQNKNSSGA
jgi:glutaminyl-tRNA synthetase